MRPIDVATETVFQWIDAHLPETPSRILEIGCGTGELAARLMQAGHEVIAIDSSEACIQQARDYGVDARVATWPEFEADPFDIILFTRSLHHITPLEPALDRVHDMLKPDGKVIVEEFDFRAARHTEIAWLYGALNLLRASGQLKPDADGMAANLLANKGDFATWKRPEDIHTIATILHALVERFALTINESQVFLFRYAIPLLPDDEVGHELATALLDMETRLAETGGIAQIGRWFVGQREN